MIVGAAVTVEDAVTVTAGALGEVSEGCWDALGEVVMTAEEAVAEAVAEAVVLEYNGAVLLAWLLAGCEKLPTPGAPPTLYLGIGGLAIEVLKLTGRVVCAVSEAGGEKVMAEVKVHSCVVMIVGVGAWAVRDW
jgi:hypothetical protein